MLCRLALGGGAIDATSFTTVRLFSGAVILVLASRFAGRRPPTMPGNWGSAFFLFAYALAFSLAYRSLAAGTGALILFGAVQATMILAGLRAGERPGPREWLGLLLAVGGLVYLVLPGISSPSPLGAALMVAAGVAWGGYSLQGRGAGDPVAVTTVNFTRATPFAVVASLATLSHGVVSPRGLLLAILSGALASGGGYVLWYAVVRRMPATLAATVQLAVPVLAAVGGVIFLSERVTLRLTLAGLAILGGVVLAVLGRTSPSLK